jgi:hypothetical protein
MEHFAGIDVSLKDSSICVVDAAGRIVREAKVASEPEALIAWFGGLGLAVTRIGLEAGPLSQWLHAGLTGAKFEAVLLEARHVKAALSAMVVKTDRKSLPRRRPGTPAASRSCCGWAGSGRCTASLPTPKRCGHCWSGASCCKASCGMSS